MAAFEPSYTGLESEDGLTVLFTNTSFNVSNDEGYIKSNFGTNELILEDAYGQQLDILSFVESDSVIWEKTKDYFVRGTLSMDGVDAYETIHDFPFKRIAHKKHGKVLQAGKCHGNKHKDNYCKALGYLLGAEDDAFILGNEVSYQINIDAANSYLDLLV